MPNTKPIEKISREFVEALLAAWNGDLGFNPVILQTMRDAKVDQIDVLEVLEDGVTTNFAKETPDEAIFERSGKTVVGANLRVTVSYNPHLPYLYVKEVTVL